MKLLTMIGYILLLMGAYLISGFVTMWIWNYLAVYFGFMKITLPIGILISLIISALTSK